ncbi:MAG TPA: hypothetical protein VN372_01500 [Methanospirillum sp.]|nr:hypothetical protein [Methanospirillum sp.]
MKDENLSQDNSGSYHLIVDEASGGSFEKLDNGTYQLTLSGIDDTATATTNAPFPIVQSIPMNEQIIGDSFDNRTMPAAIMLHQSDSPDSDAVIMQLSDPHIDTTSSTLSYTADPISYSGTNLKSFTGYADQSLPDQFGSVSIYYDPIEASGGTEDELEHKGGCDSTYKANCYAHGAIGPKVLIGETSDYCIWKPFQCVPRYEEGKICFMGFPDQCNSPDSCYAEMIRNCYWV